MGAGLPILSVDFPEMRSIINEERCGLLIKDQSVQAIQQEIEILLDKPELIVSLGAASKKAFSEKYSWEFMEAKLLSGYSYLKGR